MRNKITAVLLTLIAAGALNGSAAASITNPVIDWVPLESFAYEPNFVMPFQSLAGNPLTIVGKITLDFNPPMAFDNPVNGSYEYTFVIDQLTSQGSVFVEQGNFDIWTTNYTGGRISIYKDASLNRDYGTNPPNPTAPSTFNDGELILQGTLSNFRTVSNAWAVNNNGGNYNADIVFNGGTQWPLISSDVCTNDTGANGYLIGVWQRNLTGTPAGYIRSCDGKVDMNACSVPSESSTWGRIKSLYR